MDNLVGDILTGEDSQAKLMDKVGLGMAVALAIVDILKAQHHNLVGAYHTVEGQLKDSTEVVEAECTSFEAVPFPSYILAEQLRQVAKGSSLAIGEERHIEVRVGSKAMVQNLATCRKLVVELRTFAIVVPMLRQLALHLSGTKLTSDVLILLFCLYAECQTIRSCRH